MDTECVVASQDEYIHDIIPKATQSPYILPVIDDKQKVVGTLSNQDILNCLVISKPYFTFSKMVR